MSVYYLTSTPANPATTHGELKLKRVSYRNQNEERESLIWIIKNTVIFLSTNMILQDIQCLWLMLQSGLRN